MNDRTKAALIGGAVAGILSGILSLIPVANWCCCLWAIGGGILAIFVYTKSTKATMTPGEGAGLGVIAGAIGAVLYLIISLPLTLLLGAAVMTAQMEQLARSGVSVPLSGPILLVVGVIVSAVILFGLTVLGGVIGAAIFGKGAGPAAPPPPPPPSYGGPGGV